MDKAIDTYSSSSKRSSLPSFSSRDIPSSPSVSVRRQSFQNQHPDASSERKRESRSGLQRTWSMDSVKSDSEESTRSVETSKRENTQMSNNAHPYQIVSSSSAVLSRGNPAPSNKNWVPTHRSSRSLSSMPSDPSYQPRPLPTPPHATLPPSFSTPVHVQTSPRQSSQGEEGGDVRGLTRRWEERGSHSSGTSSASQSESEEHKSSGPLQSKRRTRSLDEQIVLKDGPNQAFALHPSQTSEDKACSLLPPSPPISTSSSSDLGSPPLAPTLPSLTVDSQPSRYLTLSRSTNRTRPKRASDSLTYRPWAGSDCDSDEEDDQSRTFMRNVTARPSKALIASLIDGSVESKKDEQSWTAQGSIELREETEYKHVIQGLVNRIEVLEERLSGLERISASSLQSFNSETSLPSAVKDPLSVAVAATPSTAELSALSHKDQPDRKRERPVYVRDASGYLILVSIGVSIVTCQVLWQKYTRGRG